MKKVIVIGGGPVGLNAALEFSKYMNVTLLEAEPFFGGQISKLYPQKEIVDIDGISSIIAKDYIALLVEKCLSNPNISLLSNRQVEQIIDGEKLQIKTKDTTFYGDYLLIATGLGMSKPRKMGLEHEDECQNILYSLQELEMLKDKNVLVLGGGDSALDWTREISKISHYVTIIHRREEFRGNFETIKDLNNVIIKKPFIPVKINFTSNKLTSLVIQNVISKEEETLNADYIFVNYGNIPYTNTFNLHSEGNGLIVDKMLRTNIKNVFAIGDIARYDNKKFRIQPGINEIRKIIDYIVKKK